jgi:hypothetical protein
MSCGETWVAKVPSEEYLTDGMFEPAQIGHGRGETRDRIPDRD